MPWSLCCGGSHGGQSWWRTPAPACSFRQPLQGARCNRAGGVLQRLHRRARPDAVDNIPPDAAASLTALAEQNGGIMPFAPLEGFIRGALMEGDPLEKQDALVAQLVDQPFSLFSTPVDTAPFEALELRKAFLFCRRDHSADYPGMATRLGRYEVIVADGSHQMLFSAPKAFAKALLTIASTDCDR
jgi:hypothetical protein